MMGTVTKMLEFLENMGDIKIVKKNNYIAAIQVSNQISPFKL